MPWPGAGAKRRGAPPKPGPRPCGDPDGVSRGKAGPRGEPTPAAAAERPTRRPALPAGQDVCLASLPAWLSEWRRPLFPLSRGGFVGRRPLCAHFLPREAGASTANSCPDAQNSCGASPLTRPAFWVLREQCWGHLYPSKAGTGRLRAQGVTWVGISLSPEGGKGLDCGQGVERRDPGTAVRYIQVISCGLH